MEYIYKNKKTGKYFNDTTFFSSDGNDEYPDVNSYKKEDVDNIKDAEIFINLNYEWIKQINRIFNWKIF